LAQKPGENTATDSNGPIHADIEAFKTAETQKDYEAMIAFINSDVPYPKSPSHPWIKSIDSLGAFVMIKLSHLFSDRLFCQNQNTQVLLERSDCIDRVL
jgi:hypothetical protein